jgi:Fe-S-cluster containining protein
MNEQLLIFESQPTWKLSAKSAERKIDCTLHGILSPGGCLGQCCRSKSACFWPPNSGTALDYKGECVCPNLTEKGCRFQEQDRPVQCLLYPFVLNDKNTMVIHFRAPSICKGCINSEAPRIIDALRQNFTALFGEGVYFEMVKSVNNGKDYIFTPSKEVLKAYEYEQQTLEPDRIIPKQRSGYGL